MIPLGILASSRPQALVFSATGGDITVDANGFRHHIFYNSGTLTVTGGTTTAQALYQYGGWPGQAGNSSYTSSFPSGNVRGGVGGFSFAEAQGGELLSDVNVVVGGSTSSTYSDMSNPYQINSFYHGGGPGAELEGYFQTETPAFDGISGPTLSSVDWIYVGMPAGPTGLGGGGGGGAAKLFDYDNGIFLGSDFGGSGGTVGAGSGGNAYSLLGASGAYGTGGAGGGGFTQATSYNGMDFVSADTGGYGGSGFAIISYQIASA